MMRLNGKSRIRELDTLAFLQILDMDRHILGGSHLIRKHKDSELGVFDL